MEITFKIIAVISPFIASGLTYFLGIKKTRKEIDLKKERVMNKVLADLLNSMRTVSQLKLFGELSNFKADTIFPLEQLPQLILSSELINLHHFEELENSVSELKEYDAVNYYYLEGIGRDFETLHNNYLSPILKAGDFDINNPKTRNPLFKLIDDTIDSLEEQTFNISEMLNSKVNEETIKIIAKIKEKGDLVKMVKDVELYYFEFMSPFLIENEPITFGEFKEFSKTEDFKEILQIQLLVAKSGKLKECIEIVQSNPHISFEELMEQLTTN